jgi:hypothetical protein
VSGPVHISRIIAQIMKDLERRRRLEKSFASRPKSQGRGLSPRPAGIESARIGSLSSGESSR